MPAISIITPTYRRDARLQAQWQQVRNQTLSDFEWLILDDSQQPSRFFLALDDPRVRYHHQPGARQTIGAKRNWLAERAGAPIIAQFDDDDYYAPGYLAEMNRRLADGADFAKLSGWFLYSAAYRKLAYWDTRQTRGLHFRFSAEELKAALFGDAESRSFAGNYLGYGFSYVYRKAVWEKFAFPSQDYDEDGIFIAAALAAGFRLNHFADTHGLCLHVLGQDNTSLCWPQYVLPEFMLDQMFAGARPIIAA